MKKEKRSEKDFNETLTLINNSGSDSDDQRTSKIIFRGRRTDDDGSLGYLCEIAASHSGTGTDDKGVLRFRLNDGDDDTGGLQTVMKLGPSTEQHSGIARGGGANTITLDTGASGSDDRLVFGVGSDLNLYSDGTNVRYEGDNLHFKNAAGDEFHAKMINGGSVELYYDGEKTLSTFTNALHLFGNTSECNIDLKLSTGVRCGFLGFTNSGRVQINGAAGGSSYETYFEGNFNGSSKLFFNNSSKLETTNTGACLLYTSPSPRDS